MSDTDAKSQPTLGFLTVIENATLGFLGGYLILNAAGRPLEFHCTAPVKPTRAQEILYGPTLKPFLFGEQIGQTLLNKSKLRPLVVCTNKQALLAARELCSLPIAHVLADDKIEVDTPACGVHEFRLARHRVVTAARFRADEQSILAAWPVVADHLDLLEPFARIEEALEEAQKTARQAA